MQKHEWVIVLLLVMGGAFVGTVGSVFIDEKFVNPPLQLIGVCSPPYHLTFNSQHIAEGCVLYTIATQTAANGQVTQKNVSMPEGQLYYYNDTELKG